MAAIGTFLAGLALVLHSGVETWEARLAEAQRTYDLDRATSLVEALQESQAPPWLRARAQLLMGELLRIRYEDTPADAWAHRRELGHTIDNLAESALHGLEGEEDSSEVWRARADLIGLTIRTAFRATQHRSAMIAAAEHAIEADPANPRAYLSRAKPDLFAPPGHGRDLDTAMQLIDRALAIEPTLEPALLLKAYTLHLRGESEAAVEILEDVLERNPDCRPASEWSRQWSIP